MDDSGQRKFKRGAHPKSLANWRNLRWQKGQSGNPDGTSLTAELQEMLGKPLVAPPDTAPAKRKFVYAQLLDAIENHDRDARKEIWQRIEGLLTQVVSGPDNAPLIEQRSLIVYLLSQPDTARTLLGLERALASRASRPSEPV